jgi:hypothetical protein
MEKVDEKIAAREKEIQDQRKKGGVNPIQPVVEALDKVVEKISFRAVSNAASGSAPGKLSGADINTSAGLEMFLKSFEPGYGEPKEVVLLKEIKKEIQKGNNQDRQDKVAELAGAT